MEYNFEWDPVKEKQNVKKHGINFQRASKVFLDPFAITIFDEEHSEDEDRWVTIGAENNEVLLVVVHTFRDEKLQSAVIRIISARKADKDEAKQYKERQS
ncbi:MAG: BrnT family toxin [Anaerolineales bacterium]|nr:BrnT family toxin [Anaerolineales bacterium]